MGVLSEKGAVAREMEERKIFTLFVVSFHQLTSRLGKGRYRQPCLRAELISDNNAITEASPPSSDLLPLLSSNKIHLCTHYKRVIIICVDAQR